MPTTFKTSVLAALAAAAALAPLSDAMAGGGKGKDYYVQEYYFSQPMNGKEGFEGAYFCSYVKQPVEVPQGNGKTKRVWKLTQVCQ